MCGVRIRDDAEQTRKRERRRRRRRIALTGQLLAGVISGVVSGLLALLVAYLFFGLRPGRVNVAVVTPTPFGELTARGTLNGSALVPTADSEFLVVDDLTDDAFYELRFGPDGTKAGPLERRPITGLEPGHVEDFEGATLVERGGERLVVAVSSLELTEGENVEAGLVRVRLDPSGVMRGETMPGFRTWLVTSFPEIGAGSTNLDALDVGGLAWDGDRGSLLFGLRYPTSGGKPFVLEVKVKDWAGSWTTSNLERVGVTTFARDDTAPGEKGILDLARLPDRPGFAVLLGDAAGRAKHAALYIWDGGATARRVDELVFSPEMKPEGIAFGSIAGKPVAVLVDDTGGYYVVRQDEFDAKVLAAT
jgi:hypothetical protein